jgi:hypothetical protein
MTFQFRKNVKGYPVHLDEVLLKFLEEHKKKKSCLILKDEWLIKFPIWPKDDLHLKYYDSTGGRVTNPLLEYDLAGAIYDELSSELTVKRRMRRRVAVSLFMLFSEKNIFLDPTNYYHIKSHNQIMDLKEAAFYDHICKKIEATKDFIFDFCLYVGALITLVLMWNHDAIHRLAHIPVMQ